MTNLHPSLDEKFWHLCQCPLFKNLSKDELKALKKAGEFVDIWRPAKRVPLSSEPGVYLLKMGYARLIYLDESGNEATTLLLRPGDMFGFFEEKASLFAVECVTVTPTCFLRIPLSRFEALLRRHSQVGYTISRLSFSGLKRLESKLAEAMLYPVEVRVCRVLLDILRQDEEENGDEASERGRLPLPLSAAELGRLSGTSREFASRQLQALEDQGLIERSGKRVRLIDLQELRRRARLEQQNGTAV